jgi:hypothetical protein
MSSRNTNYVKKTLKEAGITPEVVSSMDAGRIVYIKSGERAHIAALFLKNDRVSKIQSPDKAHSLTLVYFHRS